MYLSETMRPFHYEMVLGNKELVERLKTEKDKKSTILYGNTGCGKSTLARLYLPSAKVYNGCTISNDEIRCMRREVIIDEIHSMNRSKQQMLGELIETRKCIIVGTTLENPYFSLHPTVRTRMRMFEVQFPPIEEVVELVNKIMAKRMKTIDESATRYLCDKYGDLRKIIDTIQLLRDSDKTHITIDDLGEIEYTGNNSMESLKSALQKSIRGSDPDASVLYANALLDLGYLEEMCRRLRVIVSEDIGLANPNAIMISNALIENALSLGMPECKFPIIELVIFLAIQPKSGSVHEAINKAKECGVFTVPSHIATVHPKNYKYPHNYPNNYCEQEYMPIELRDKKLYYPGNNKIEQGYKEYWDKIKNKE